MSMLVKTTALYLVWSWSILLTAPFSHAADAPAAATDQPFVVTAPQLKPLATAWASCSLGRMIQGPDMQPYRAELDKNDIGCLIRLRPWFGWDWSELADVLGQVTFIIVPSTPANASATATPEAELVCIISKDKDNAATAACRAAGEAYFGKLGIKPTTQLIGKVTCTIYNYKPKTGSARTTVYCEDENFLTATTSIRSAELVLDRRYNKALHDPLTDGAGPGLVRFAIEPLPLIKLLAKPPVKGKRNFVKFFERQGGAAIKLVRGTIDLPAQGALELSVNAELQGEFPLPKGLGVLNYQAVKAPDLNELFGKPAHSVRHWSWDFPVAMKSIANLFDEMNEPGPSGEGLFDDLIDGLRDDPEGPQVDLRKGLFTQLGPGIKEVAFAGDKNETASTQHKIMMIACLDEAAVKQTLEKYYKNDKKVGKDTTDGRLIWHVSPGKSLFVEGQNKSTQNFEAATVSNKVLYLCDNYQALLDYFAGGARANGPKEIARFTAADQASLAASGPTVGFRSLSLTEQAWRVTYEKLQVASEKNEPATVAMLRTLFFGEEAARPQDLGKSLPDWSKLAPLAPPSFNLLNPEAPGMRWQSGFLRSP